MLPSSDPRIWGPVVWDALFVIACNYPHAASSDDVLRMCAFLAAMSHQLPCPVCGAHFRAFMRSRDLRADLASRDCVVQTLVDSHNDICIKTGGRRLSSSQVLRIFSVGKAQNENVGLWLD